jgi:hypothetical protein
MQCNAIKSYLLIHTKFHGQRTALSQESLRSKRAHGGDEKSSGKEDEHDV